MWLSLPIFAVRAQNPPQPTQPTQPSPPVQPAQPPNAQNPNAPNPDNGSPFPNTPPVPPVQAADQGDMPLTGAAQPPIGVLNSRSYLQPSLSYFGQIDSNAYNSPQAASAVSINTVLGSLALEKFTPHSELNIDYLGGYSFSNEGGLFNSATQEFGLADLWSRGRWTGLFADQLSYSSQSSFFGGVTAFDVSGLMPVGPIILQNTFMPGQSIITSFGPRISNASVVEINNRVSRRVTATLVGNYETLRFLDAGLIDSSSAGFQAGLNYDLDRRNVVAIAYRFNHLWFSGVPDSVADNVILAAYERHIGDRMVLELGAGPEIAFIRNSSLTSTTYDTWAANALLRYQFKRGSLYATYGHFLSGGSGVFLGAETHLISLGASRQLSRAWTGTLIASYGHNTNILGVTTSTNSAPPGATFDTAFGGFEMHRRVGKESQLFFGYLARYQTSSTPYCTIGVGLACGGSFFGHQINFGFSWKPNPIPIG